jgi:hypothetical protein
MLKEENSLRVFVNGVLRKIFGPKRDKVKGNWRKLHNKELHDLWSSPNMIRVIISSGMRWVGHVTRMVGGGGGVEVCCKSLGRERDHLEDLGICGNLIVKLISKQGCTHFPKI